MTSFEHFYGQFKDTVKLMPGCCVRSQSPLLEAMKSVVRGVKLAYGVAKACQGLRFPLVRSRGSLTATLRNLKV